MKPFRAFIKRHQLFSFVVLAYLIAWLPVLAGGNGLLPHGVLLAALIVVGVSDGKAGVKAWWGRVIQRRHDWRWYLLAAAIPPAITLLAAGLNRLLGAQLPAQIDWSIPFQVLPIMVLVSGMWEEPGWTGFALPHLFQRFGASAAGVLVATLIMAVIRVGWHLPLMLSGNIYWTDIVLIIAVQMVIAWLFNATATKGIGGSVLAVMLLHLVNNTVSGEFVQQWFTGADWVRQSWLLAVLWSLLAIGLFLLTYRQLDRKVATGGEEIAYQA